MRTNEERMRLIQKRTKELKKQEVQRKQKLQAGLCLAACCVLIVGLAFLFPTLLTAFPESSQQTTSGAASLLGSTDALGYIMMGIFSFLLGVCVTLLLYHLKRKNRSRKETDDEF